MHYLTTEVTKLCYRAPWYSKLTGCSAISQLIDLMHDEWTAVELACLLDALFFVPADLMGQVRAQGVYDRKLGFYFLQLDRSVRTSKRV